MQTVEPDIPISDAEERFDLWRRRIGLIAAPLAFAAVWLLATGLETPARKLGAILAAVVVLWVSEAIPMAITAFLGVAASVVLGVAPAQAAFAPFADPLVFLFVGTFILARAIFFHGLDRRFAFAILGLRGVGERPGRVLIAYAVTAGAISMWISNTATTAMMFPIGVALLRSLESLSDTPLSQRHVSGFAAALLLSNAFAASIGGLATPVGTPPNLIGIGFIRQETGVDVSFFAWMALGVPVVLLALAAMLARFHWSAIDRDARLDGVAEFIAVERAALGPWTRGQVNTVIAFAFAVTFWVLPGVLALALGSDHPLCKQLASAMPEGVVALLAAVLLFLLPTDLRRMEFTLDWREAVQIDWWIVFLYGGGIALGTLAFKTGLAEALGFRLTALLGVQSELGLIVLATVISTVLSETTSNTASANMVVPVVIAFARSSGIDPVLPAVAATMGASLGFMLPVSTPCNAIVYASGRIPLTTMMRHGIWLDVAGIAAVITVVSLLGPLVRGALGG
ncbi:DASS family sodium-coupled anion symporter [Candidatus Binatia bacterium]|nr:DASS family sodium-coupled anion symporter [Candidatus Binatia bacterium]